MSLQAKLDALTSAQDAAPDSSGTALREAIMKLIDDEEHARPLKVGDLAPRFELRSYDDVSVASDELLKAGPLVLTFYRGRRPPRPRAAPRVPPRRGRRARHARCGRSRRRPRPRPVTPGPRGRCPRCRARTGSRAGAASGPARGSGHARGRRRRRREPAGRVSQMAPMKSSIGIATSVSYFPVPREPSSSEIRAIVFSSGASTTFTKSNGPAWPTAP